MMIRISRKSNFLEAFGIFCGALILFTIALNYQEVIGFESRFYLFALEMWRHGPSWFPTTYGTPYPDYPVTSTLLIYGVAKMLGHLDRFAAVLPSAIAAAVTLAFTFKIGALHDRSLGWGAVFCMLLTNGFLLEARTISPDQYVLMATTLSFYCAYAASLSLNKKFLFAIPFLLALGFAFRGPIGLVVPAGVLCVFYLLDNDYKKFFITGFLALFVLGICSAILFGIAYHVGDVRFMQDVLRMEVLGRMQDAHLPWYFYFTESIGAYAITYPLTILVVTGLAGQLFKKTLSEELKFLQKLVGWALVILIGLSVPAGKKIRYVLPMVPALALISAYLFTQFQSGFIGWLKEKVFYILYFLPLIAIALLVAVMFISLHKAWNFDIHYPELICAFLVLFFLVKRNQREINILAIAALTFVIVYIAIIEPVNQGLNSTQAFVLYLENLRHQQKSALVFYKENPDAWPIKYILNMPKEEKPKFINTPEELENFPQRALFVSDPDIYLGLPKKTANLFKVFYSGRVGHTTILVFQKRSDAQ
jgi:4-amino-4-deoxy-L-arabinose transferase-like glycosyltransferase